MKLPILAAAALIATVGAASAQWGPPPPGFGPGPGYGAPPPPGSGYYRGDRGDRGYGYGYGRGHMVRRCWFRDTPWGPRRVCRMVPARGRW